LIDRRGIWVNYKDRKEKAKEKEKEKDKNIIQG
jgi:hypothetical protein